MNFYELEAFVTLSNTLHFGKTANLLNMSPSALSRVISRIEEETNTILLERNNRQVLLTEQGKIFKKYASEILNKKDELNEKLIERKSDDVNGTLSLYASVTACYSILPDFIKRLLERYPKIQFSIETGDPDGATLAVRENRAILAVAAIPENGLNGMDTILIKKTPLVFAASNESLFTDIEGSPQDIISSTPIILPKSGIARTRFDKWTKSRNVKPKIVAETEGNEAILAVARLGLGIGLVPQIVLENGPYKGLFKIHTAGNALGYYDVGFIIKKDFSGNIGNKKVFDAVKNILSAY